MISVSTYYSSIKNLEQFINNHVQIEDGQSLLIQIFSGVIDKSVLQEIASYLSETLPMANIIGSTTDGEIFDEEVTTENIVITFSIFSKSTIEIASIQTQCNDDSFKSGQTIAKELTQKNSKLFILFASGLCVNGEEFLNGVQSVNDKVIVSGGLSADNAQFKSSYLICNSSIQNTGAVGVSINSDLLEVKKEYSLAWENLGRKFTVEKSCNNRVYLIDGKTPFDLYKHYLGDEVAQKLPGIGIEFPLIIQRDNEKIARAVIKVHDDHSMSFAGNIKEGSIVRFGIGNIEALLNGSFNVAQRLNAFNNESIFIYSCMARRRFLENKAHLDIEHFSHLAPVSGFFTYGEFFSTQNHHELLNESLTLVSLSEHPQLKNEHSHFEDHSISNDLLKQKALSTLINKTSEELEVLTSTLEKQVEDKTEKILSHERYIFEQDKMAQLGEMIANIAHQWRQPLSAISSNASALIIQEKLGLTNQTEMIETLERIVKNTQFLSDTINTFRNYIHEGNQTTQVIVQERLNMVLDIMSTTLNDCKIRLINNIDYSKPIAKNLILGELSQVVLNIMNNAKDILLEKEVANPWVKIDCHSENDTIIIRIEDNGGGIPQHLIDNVFEPYFTTKQHNDGTGIGLYMSRNILQNHFNGDLTVQNTQNGAEFTISIPFD